MRLHFHHFITAGIVCHQANAASQNASTDMSQVSNTDDFDEQDWQTLAEIESEASLEAFTDAVASIEAAKKSTKPVGKAAASKAKATIKAKKTKAKATKAKPVKGKAGKAKGGKIAIKPKDSKVSTKVKATAAKASAKTKAAVKATASKDKKGGVATAKAATAKATGAKKIAAAKSKAADSKAKVAAKKAPVPVKGLKSQMDSANAHLAKAAKNAKDAAARVKKEKSNLSKISKQKKAANLKMQALKKKASDDNLKVLAKIKADKEAEQVQAEKDEQAKQAAVNDFKTKATAELITKAKDSKMDEETMEKVAKKTEFINDIVKSHKLDGISANLMKGLNTEMIDLAKNGKSPVDAIDKRLASHKIQAFGMAKKFNLVPKETSMEDFLKDSNDFWTTDLTAKKAAPTTAAQTYAMGMLY